MNDFPKIMNALKDIYDTDNDKLPKVFWDTIDGIPNETLFPWVERLLNIKGLLLGQDYITVTGIQHDYRVYESWTIKQKRRVAIELIKHWYEVEFRYELI